MARSRRESHHNDGITDPARLQQTSATKSAQSGHCHRAERCPLLGVKQASDWLASMSAFDGEFNRSLQHTARSQLAGGFKAQGLARVLMNHRANLAGYA